MKFTGNAYRPYVSALGQMVLSWNSLQEILGITFVAVMNCGNDEKSHATWHAISSDRMQREVLIATVNVSEFLEVFPSLQEDIRWLCDNAKKLEDFRNDALHSPFWLGAKGKAEFMSLTIFGHIRAKKLDGKNMLKDFKWCRDTSVVLSDFAWQIARCVPGPNNVPWPERPKLLTRGATNSPKSHSPTAPTKPAPLRPTKKASKKP